MRVWLWRVAPCPDWRGVLLKLPGVEKKRMLFFEELYPSLLSKLYNQTHPFFTPPRIVLKAHTGRCTAGDEAFGAEISRAEKLGILGVAIKRITMHSKEVKISSELEIILLQYAGLSLP